MMKILNIVDRKAEIRNLAHPTPMIKQRMAVAAQELTRAGNAAIRVELVNEALCRFTAMLYERDQDGVWPNIDIRTYRLLVAAPWGSAGWKRWGLRKWEARIMRGIMLGRVTDKRRPCLFDYNTEARTWYLNGIDYPVFDAAQHYLSRAPITLAEWRRYTSS